MATTTTEGYSAYPSGLSAEEFVSAIKRAFNLDEELSGYIKRTLDNTPPATSRTGDFFSDGERNFVAFAEGANYLWIEI